MKIDDLIKQPEGRTLEFKEDLPKKSDLNKTIVSFANDAGGRLIIGIKDTPRKVVGVNEDDRFIMEEKISALIHDNCTPVILPEISFRKVEDKHIAIVQIFRGNTPPYFIKSKGEAHGTYIRVGSANRLANQEIIDELIRKRSNISFDSLMVHEKELKELNISEFKQHFFEITKEELSGAVLKKLNLIRIEGKRSFPTNALVLLSNDDLKAKLFPYSKVECARFKGDIPGDFIDQKTIDGPLSLQAEEAYQFILRHISKGSSYDTVYRKDKWEYPVIALREVIRNAIIHRDYSLTGKDIKIAVFDNKIEITSPGTLLPSIDLKDVESGQSDIRNKVLAPVFKRLGIIEQWGNGLKLIAQDLLGYPDISFDWTEPSIGFRATFAKTELSEKRQNIHAEPFKEVNEQTITDDNEQLRTITDDYGRLRTITDDYESLSIEKKKILLYILDNGRITRREAVGVTSHQKSKVFEILNEMVKEKLLLTKGKGRATHYILNKNDYN